MLVHLHVRNLALIEDIEVEFGPGLNILTGETGAGKSILLGSMQLILGGRSAKDMIRTGASSALVELLFQVENPRAEASLRELGVETSEGQVLLTRKLMDGRSINKINGETCTVAQMKAAASCLLDIHGQHEHQSLLYQDKQLEILDIYGKEEIFPAKDQVQKSYKEYRDCKRQLDELDIDEEQRNRERAFLEFEINEIESAQLVSGEDEELEKRYCKLNNGRKILETLQGVRDLTGYESGQGAGESVGNAVREISRVTEYDTQLDSMASALQEIDGLLNDFNRELASYVDDLNFDDEAFYETEKRLDTINGLKAKYGRTIEDIQEYCLKQKQKLENLDKYEERFHEAEENLKKSREELETVSHKLSVIRQKYSQMLTDKITEGLKDLNFLDVQFQITFRRRKEYTAGGFDDIEYEISTNPGESLKPLGKIVSGGELSRIMLAIKAILADRDQIETLIFDEIDTGVSGSVAFSIGKKMRQLAQQTQVFCVTHLASVAACAQQHYVVEKHQESGHTETTIRLLSKEERIQEMAVISQGSASDSALRASRELYELACKETGNN